MEKAGSQIVTKMMRGNREVGIIFHHKKINYDNDSIIQNTGKKQNIEFDNGTKQRNNILSAFPNI